MLVVVRRLVPLALLALLVLPGCLGLRCPCGSDSSDPLSQHDLSFAGSHTLAEECECRCGGDEPIGRPRDRDCADYDAPCVDREGRDATLECQ